MAVVEDDQNQLLPVTPQVTPVAMTTTSISPIAMATSPPDTGESPKSDGRGPRIKHVCRKAAVVLGKPVAKFPTRQAEITLSALPSGEKVKLWKKEQETRKGEWGSLNACVQGLSFCPPCLSEKTGNINVSLVQLKVLHKPRPFKLLKNALGNVRRDLDNFRDKHEEQYIDKNKFVRITLSKIENLFMPLVLLLQIHVVKA